MLTKLFFPTVPCVRVERVGWEGHTLHLAATATRRAACCPLCGRRSKRVHSFYPRTIRGLSADYPRTIRGLSADARRPPVRGCASGRASARSSLCVPRALVPATDLL
jgi:hypothetical protein